MSDKLPDKVVDIETVRLIHGTERKCTCKKLSFIVDPENKEVTCGECGAQIDPFEAMVRLAEKPEKLKNEVQQLLEQKQQIKDYKPHLIVIKKLENRIRGKKEIPVCPHCRRGIYPEELLNFMSREFEERRRQKEKGDKNHEI